MLGPDGTCLDSRLHVCVRTLAGRELTLSLAPDALVKDLKGEIKSQWGVPMVEQKLLHGVDVMPDAQYVGNYVSNSDYGVLLVRGPAFHFDQKLGHPRIKIGAQDAVIKHGGQREYQAAFLSDVLDNEGCYSVRFMLEDAGGNLFKEMYVGVAPDSNRNWSNLKGAYLNHRGLFVDAFDESGWDTKKRWAVRDLIFHRSDHQLAARRRASECEKALDEPDACEFVLEVDMPANSVRFLTLNGTAVDVLHLPGLQAEPIRLCATLGYPEQSVSIVDA